MQFAKEHEVDYVPMPYVLDENEVNYHLGEFTNFKEFYDKVREGKLPQTSTYPPEYYVEKLAPYLENGQDILFISFSSQLSSAFSYLSLACEQLRVITSYSIHYTKLYDSGRFVGLSTFITLPSV